MVLLILGDSQIERIWPSVRLDREVLRDAIYFPVKNRGAIMQGFKSITANVSICTNITLVLTYISKLYYSKNIVRLFEPDKFFVLAIVTLHLKIILFQ